jgi:lipoprotein-releasing system permease protein
MKGKVSGIRLKVDDLFNAKKITNEVVNSLNSSQYYGVDWTQQKANFIKALNLMPMVLRMAISAFLSVTTMTIIETILKAATAIINDNIIATEH